MNFLRYSLLLSTTLLFNFQDCCGMEDNIGIEEEKNKVTKQSKILLLQDSKKGSVTPNSHHNELITLQEKQNSQEKNFSLSILLDNEVEKTKEEINVKSDNDDLPVSKEGKSFEESRSQNYQEENEKNNNSSNTNIFDQNLFDTQLKETAENNVSVPFVFSSSDFSSLSTHLNPPEKNKTPESKQLKVFRNKKYANNKQTREIQNNTFGFQNDTFGLPTSNTQFTSFEQFSSNTISSNTESFNWENIKFDESVLNNQEFSNTPLKWPFPKNVTVIILSFLDTKSLIQCRLVNREFNNILNTKITWKSLKAYWPRNSYTSKDLNDFRNILKLKIESLFLVNFLPNDLIYSDIGNKKESLTELDLSQSKNTTNDCLFYFSELENLKRLTLTNLPISDNGIWNLWKLQNLETLNLHGTTVTGKLFYYLENSYNSLKKVNLHAGQYVRKINVPLKGINKFSSLKELKLNGYSVSDEDMHLLQNLTNLKSLDLSFNPINDNNLKYLNNLTNLTFLDLSNTQVTAASLLLMGTINNFSKLKTLNLNKTKAGDFGLSFLENFKKIQDVSFKNAQVSLDNIIQYYENVTKINSRSLGKYTVITQPNTNDIEDFFHKISKTYNQWQVYVKKEVLSNDEIIKYYEKISPVRFILK